ncbi:MAG: hypothetical protein F6K39_00545 [Okeania sp. SIO3B3]|nr:hypothetical protein [Okeania sp. SIO3B3]
MKTLLKWTVQEYHHLINTGIFVNRHVELLHGEIVEMSPESPIHTQITETSVEYLRSLLKELAYVREAHPITLSNSEPQPDIAIAPFLLPSFQYFTPPTPPLPRSPAFKLPLARLTLRVP